MEGLQPVVLVAGDLGVGGGDERGRRIEAGILRQHAGQAAREQRRADHEQQRQGHLEGDERASTGPVAEQAARRLVLIAKHQAGAQARRSQCRQQRPRRDRERGERQREGEDAAVRRDVDRQRQIGGRHHRHQRPAHPLRGEHAGGGADRAPDQRLGQQLTNQSPAAGANRQPHGELAPARDAAGDQQVGGAGAGDRAQQADEGEQQPQRLLELTADA